MEIKGLDKGVCKFCGKSIYWTRSAKNNKPMPVELKAITGVDKYGEVVTIHESHVPYCENYPGNKMGK